MTWWRFTGPGYIGNRSDPPPKEAIEGELYTCRNAGQCMTSWSQEAASAYEPLDHRHGQLQVHMTLEHLPSLRLPMASRAREWFAGQECVIRRVPGSIGAKLTRRETPKPPVSRQHKHMRLHLFLYRHGTSVGAVLRSLDRAVNPRQSDRSALVGKDRHRSP